MPVCTISLQFPIRLRFGRTGVTILTIKSHVLLEVYLEFVKLGLVELGQKRLIDRAFENGKKDKKIIVQ